MGDNDLASRVFPYSVTIPAQTSSASPLLGTVPIDAGVLESVELQVPSGHVGLTGFSLVLAGTTIFPWGGGGMFVVAENAILHAALGVQVDTGLATLCYNDDFYDHTFFFRLVLGDLPPVTVTPFDAAPGTLTGAGYTGLIVAPPPPPAPGP